MATLDLYLNMPLRRLNRVAYSHLLDLIQPSPVARLFLAVAYRLTGLRPAVFWNLAAILVTSAASVPSLSHVRRGYSADHFLNHLQISVMAISSMTSGEEVLAWPIDVVLVAAVRSGGRRRNVAGTLGDMWNSFQIDAKRALRDETFPTSWHLEHAIFAAVLFEYGTLVLLGIPEAEAMRAAEIMAPLHLAARGIFHVPGDIALHRSHYTVDKLMEADVNPTWAGRCRTWEAIRDYEPLARFIRGEILSVQAVWVTTAPDSGVEALRPVPGPDAWLIRACIRLAHRRFRRQIDQLVAATASWPFDG